jgi:integral membrane protein
MTQFALHALRWIGIAEGTSFLLLLGIAMPLKYIWHMEQLIFPVGLAHGVLFVAYVFATLLVAALRKWPLSWVGLAVLASLLPFGPFVFDRKIVRELELVAAETPEPAIVED